MRSKIAVLHNFFQDFEHINIYCFYNSLCQTFFAASHVVHHLATSNIFATHFIASNLERLASLLDQLLASKSWRQCSYITSISL